jgi:hypothetical protein
MASGRVTDILTSLTITGTPRTWASRLVSECRASTQVSGVGLAVMNAGGNGGVLAATDGAAQRMEDLQFTLGEGPCMEASRSGRPVLVPDLRQVTSTRWPAYTAGAAGAGVRAAFTFPLQVGALTFGVLDLYSTTTGNLTRRQVGEALAYADAGATMLLYLQDGAVPVDGRVGDDPGREAAGSDAGHRTPLEMAAVLDRHAVVHQAAGMVSVQLDVDLAAALLRLRGHSFAVDRPILEVAADVVARRLRFDNSTAGATATPPSTSHPVEGEPS